GPAVTRQPNGDTFRRKWLNMDAPPGGSPRPPQPCRFEQLEGGEPAPGTDPDAVARLHLPPARGAEPAAQVRVGGEPADRTNPLVGGRGRDARLAGPDERGLDPDRVGDHRQP